MMVVSEHGEGMHDVVIIIIIIRQVGVRRSCQLVDIIFRALGVGVLNFLGLLSNSSLKLFFGDLQALARWFFIM